MYNISQCQNEKHSQSQKRMEDKSADACKAKRKDLFSKEAEKRAQKIREGHIAGFLKKTKELKR